MKIHARINVNAINITAAEQSHKERSTNKSSGFSVGVAIKVSNGVMTGIHLCT
ncbi:hemagglutinin repeat-containing protein [Pasteurella multocida]|uniref:hemagglutinin repeat-containing protein n=1 Tax=Pasteurella multocida TaxID=747 RepID=UPI0033116CDC|nr:hemagglutinin repeat-containing protein [Pasteurella multocida]